MHLITEREKRAVELLRLIEWSGSWYSDMADGWVEYGACHFCEAHKDPYRIHKEGCPLKEFLDEVGNAPN